MGHANVYLQPHVLDLAVGMIHADLMVIARASPGTKEALKDLALRLDDL